MVFETITEHIEYRIINIDREKSYAEVVRRGNPGTDIVPLDELEQPYKNAVVVLLPNGKGWLSEKAARAEYGRHILERMKQGEEAEGRIRTLPHQTPGGYIVEIARALKCWLPVENVPASWEFLVNQPVIVALVDPQPAPNGELPRVRVARARTTGLVPVVDRRIFENEDLWQKCLSVYQTDSIFEGIVTGVRPDANAVYVALDATGDFVPCMCPMPRKIDVRPGETVCVKITSIRKKRRRMNGVLVEE